MQSRCWINPWEKSYNRYWSTWHQSKTDAQKSGISTMGLCRHCTQYIKLDGWRQDKTKPAGAVCAIKHRPRRPSALGDLEFQSSWQYSLRCEIELQNWAVITLRLLPTLSSTSCSLSISTHHPQESQQVFPTRWGTQANCSEYSILVCL